MLPNYIAKKSVVPVLNFWLILFSPLIIPLIIQICRIVVQKSYSIEFYDEKIVLKKGVFNKAEQQFIFIAVNEVTIQRNFWGLVWNYGNININCRGQFDLKDDENPLTNEFTHEIKNPVGLKRYLETRITTGGISSMMMY